MAVINHTGLAVNIHYLDLFEGDVTKPEHLALNPNAMVPVLEDGNLCLWESNAINQYLADISKDTGLFPLDPIVRADVARWQNWELAHFNQAFGLLALEAVAKPNFMNVQGEPALINWAQLHLARFAAVLEVHLKGREYMVGEQVTLADYAIIHVEFFKEMIPFDWSPYINVNRYFAEMRQLPHWIATAPSSPELIGRIP